jgi:hypothetical protein
MTTVGTNESNVGRFEPSLGVEARLAADRAAFERQVDHYDSEQALGFHGTPVSIVDPEGLSAMGEVASSRGYLWVQLKAPGPQYRGRLGLYIEEAIEAELEERGALAPGIHSSTGLDASLSDQLYRARLVEMRGIAIGVPSLEGIVNLARALDADDSAVLRWWMAAAADRPVRLVLSNRNMSLRVYPSPVRFESLFDVAPGPVTPIPPSPEMARSAEAMDLSDLPPQVQDLTDVLGTNVSESHEYPSVMASVDDSGVSPASSWKLGPGRKEEAAVEESDIHLPDLDEALGLFDSLGADRAKNVETHSVASRDDYSPIPDLAEALSSPAEEPSSGAIQGSGVAPEDEEDEGLELSAAPALVEETRSCLGSSASPTEESTSKAAEDAPDSGGADHGLDADAFLRTLEEDSARAPQVDATLQEEGGVQGDDAVEPLQGLGQETLPTKKIGRNPFIRLASAPVIATEGPQKCSVVTGDATVEAGIENVSVSVHAAAARRPVSPELDPEDPFNQLAAREWRSWVKNLEAARGPKPLAVIERMFVTDYTRLREAVRRGVAPVEANLMLDEWQSSFEQSYSEAFDALRVRGKRPTMVLDLPELASRLGRLQGAKRVQLLLVDGMRFDLGLMVQDRMRKTAEAALTERLLLWSALPSETAYQLNLLAAGPDGLKDKDLAHLDEPPALVARGKAARVPRRVKCGKLELLKLDVVEDSLRLSDRPVLERLSEIAEDTASAIVEHLSKQAPRTMVVVFGDHGFALNPSKSGTAEEVTCGGASPEEVLVPAFAWLTGAVH